MVRRMVKLGIATVLVLGLAGCAQPHAPTLKDPNGWPYPTWARMDGLICHDEASGELVSVKVARHPIRRGADVRCSYGGQNRGVQYDQTFRQNRTPTPTPMPAPIPTAPAPGGRGPDIAR